MFWVIKLIFFRLIKRKMELIDAAKDGNQEEVRALLANGVDPNKTDKDNETPLSWASYEGHLEIVRELLANGADPNIMNKNNTTPLFWSSYNGHLNIVRELLAHGADPNIVDNYNQTPLSLASGQGHLEVVRELLAHGADPHIVNKDNRTPLYLASRRVHFEIVKELKIKPEVFMAPNPSSSRLVESDSGQFLFLLNHISKNLQFINLGNGDLVKEIELEYDGPHSMRNASGIASLEKDRFWATFSPHAIGYFNFEGKIQFKKDITPGEVVITYVKSDFHQELHKFQVHTYSNIFVGEEGLYLSLNNENSPDYDEDHLRYMVVKFDLEK